MTDQVLEILKFALLALLYLFFARVLWAVWSEVRGPRPGHLATVEHSGPSPGTATQPLGGKRTKRGTVRRLVVTLPRERKGASFSLDGELRIGRSASCTICIPDDAFVSQLHARLFLAEGTSWVEDLGSTNGSYLNGARFQGVQHIEKGDRLQIGATVWEAH